ncbi:PREDICTED: protein DBF4 homolog B isoform X1 [Gavialis gangeticus]|uniref:protein DBF4 homolog B isoform X1 n=1 Tax=Gavialis gangeticus TaxID=94835 RepID=UPI00092FD649|nr:PREDICTED: protein DBF4 homolog B isoform X1 [Gavialis gangeticus]
MAAARPELEPEPAAQVRCRADKGQRRHLGKQSETAGSSRNQPFLGKSFYLDLPNNKNTEFLLETIKHLGGMIESFLSKEVSYVVSSSKEAKLDSRPGRQTKKQSCTASWDDKAKILPSVASKGGCHVRPSPKPADSVNTALISRGKELLQKVIRNQDTWAGSSILANARSWGVRILHVDEMMAYIQQLLLTMSGARKSSQKMEVISLAFGPRVPKVGKLKPPFLKIEDQSRRFRPLHHQFKSFPDLNFLAPKGCSPFEPLKSPSSSCKTRVPERCMILSEKEKSPQSTPPTMPKKRKGFCECCQETFEDLQLHLQSSHHRQFALDDFQYAAVDHLISQLINDFVELPDWFSSSSVSCSPAADACSSSQANAMRAPAAGLGRKGLQASGKDLCLNAEDRLSLLNGECSLSPEEKPSERFDEPCPVLELSAKDCLLGLSTKPVRQTGSPAGDRPGKKVLAGCSNTNGSAVVGVAGSVPAPDLNHGTCCSTGERAACSPGSVPQQALRPTSCCPRDLSCSRKRKLSSSPSACVEKKWKMQLGSDPLCLDTWTGSTGCRLVHQEVGQAALRHSLLAVARADRTAPSCTFGVGELSLSSSRPCSSPALWVLQKQDPGGPKSPSDRLGPPFMDVVSLEAAQASTAPLCNQTEGHQSYQGGQPKEDTESPCQVHNSGLELHSAVSQSGCPTWHGPLAAKREHCSSPSVCCVGLVESVVPETANAGDHCTSIAIHPGVLQPLPSNPQACPDLENLTTSSSRSDWDIQLFSTLDSLQSTRIQPIDGEMLRRTCIDVRESGYESHLYSVLKQKPELDWAGKDDKSHWNCRTEMEGAPYRSLRPAWTAGPARH